MKVKLEGRVIPRNQAGDPAFVRLYTRVESPDEWTIAYQAHGEDLLRVFNEEEVVELVNRALYQLEYQKESHRVRSQTERDRWKPVKEALKSVHPGVAWSKATESQISDAMRWVKEREVKTTGSC